MQTPLRLALIVAAFIAWVAFPAPARACTAPPGGLPTYTVADHVNASAIVVEGTVTGVSDVNYLQVAAIQVAQYLKGSGPATLTVEGYGPSGICLSEVRAGDHFIFYITVDSAGIYHALYLSQFDAVAEANARNLAEAGAASNQTPVAITDTPTLNVNAAFTEAYATTYAAATLYPSDPAAASAALTEVGATLQTLYNITPTPCPPSAHTLAEHTAEADVVFEGVVSSAVDYSAVIQVVQYLKINTNAQVGAQINFDKTSPCYAPPRPGDHFIFFAIGEPALVMYALDSNDYRPTAPADSGAIGEVLAASGQPPIIMQSLSGIALMLTSTAQAAPSVATVGPYPITYFPPAFTVTPAPTAVEAVSLVGVGVVIGLIVGGLGGIVIGLIIGRWRE